jgi:RimJ/RimL family protein N-acetyltransferase
MTEARQYFALEELRSGRRVVIRGLRSEDRQALVSAVERSSAQALHRRFFRVKRYFSEKEIAFFVDVDFVNHVALVAETDENGSPTIVGSGRYVVLEPGTAEVAFFVIDQYQGLGLGTVLMRHLTDIARTAGLRVLTADVLPDNVAMLKMFEYCGLPLSTTRDAEVVHVTLQVS